MKNIILIFFLLVSGPFSIAATYDKIATKSVQELPTKRNGRYAILVQNVQHFSAATMTGEALLRKNPSIRFEIVLIGSVVKELALNDTLQQMAVQNHQKGIKIVVCEFAMKKLGVEKKQYPSSVYTIPDAFEYLFYLQEKNIKPSCYKTVSAIN